MTTRPNPLLRFLPFLAWFPMTRESLRADLLAGITVSLILVPQSMAYAQLAGLPVVYGLYAGFLPVIVASLWGSLRQLHTGPTAMLSLMSAAALIPYAATGSETFIALSLMLALMVGILRLALGLFRLGVVVNFLSHPVIIGFTNAAALIIGLSQLNKLVNVPMPRSDWFLGDLWVVLQQLGSTHWPTLGFGLGAFALILVLQKRLPRLPGVLIAIVVTTLASYAIDFERTAKAGVDAIEDPGVRAQVMQLDQATAELQRHNETAARLQSELARAEDDGAPLDTLLDLKGDIARSQAAAYALGDRMMTLRIQLHRVDFTQQSGADGAPRFAVAGEMPKSEPLGTGHWRFGGIAGGEVTFTGGGEVVGAIPAGVPGFQVPHVDWALVLPLLPAALVMALLGFMEATSISKAISAKTGQRIDTNRELVGQGLANIVGSFFHAYVVSGSFSRSAVAAREGARTGLFAIVSALGVLAVMLFLTPLLYHLPQAVLAAVIMLAVFGLVRVAPLFHAWKVNRPDAVIGIATFVATVAMAPALANGILLGVGLTVALYLFRNMRPRAEILGRHPDGVLGGIDTHNLPAVSEHYVALRFDGSLNFVNVAYFEDVVLQALERFPHAKAVLVIGSGINDLDVSGEEKLRALVEQLRARNVNLYFSSLKRQVLAAFERSGLSSVIPGDHIFKTKEVALKTLDACYGSGRIGPAVPA
ncbi:probable high affinity sulfate transporter (SulP) [Thiobacillus denitrificans ATCC 25259]|uniref:Probable high affinity sulfate transporter (SulP) n=1 Tax=Thiobacillus denitrificans (strain ATCC 25259 / T1) TaxID=292415 RepID=Q3SFL3_THIDA|nr:SulP family inorganic anion transporter [Thiobacillus denitrificans]AAZ98593.1 probable high affinity sulfate transporter (SulP) [Thiobacillus denitrificans ATCC 25259]